MLNQGSGLRAFIQDLGLAFVDAATAAHRGVPWFVKIHLGAVAPCRFDCPRRGRLANTAVPTRGPRTAILAMRPHRQTSRSRWRAQSKGSKQSPRQVTQKSPVRDVALTTTGRYARRHEGAGLRAGTRGDGTMLRKRQVFS